MAGAHDQRVDLPTARVALERADPTDQALALQGRIAQPVGVVAPSLDLGFRLAWGLVT
jgi:hypothetical protein